MLKIFNFIGSIIFAVFAVVYTMYAWGIKFHFTWVRWLLQAVVNFKKRLLCTIC